MTVTNIMGHLREFYKISQKPGNGGSRSVLGGYMDSLNYVRNKLKETGCHVRVSFKSELEKGVSVSVSLPSFMGLIYHL